MAHNHHEHHHGHKHLHAHGGLKGQVILIIVTILLFIGAVLIEKNCNLPTWQLLLVYLVPYLLVGYHTLAEAAEGILGGDIFNEHFLMSIATIGALCIGFLPGAETEFPEAVFVMLFFQIGELFENYAEGKSRDSISHLVDIRPDVANVEIGGKLVTVSPENVNVGDIIVIKPGEKVPLDGRIIDGTSSLNTIALTGESMPRDLSVGDDVISGCVNLTGVIRVKTTKDQKLSNWWKVPMSINLRVNRSLQSLHTYIPRLWLLPHYCLLLYHRYFHRWDLPSRSRRGFTVH